MAQYLAQGAPKPTVLGELLDLHLQQKERQRGSTSTLKVQRVTSRGFREPIRFEATVSYLVDDSDEPFWVLDDSGKAIGRLHIESNKESAPGQTTSKLTGIWEDLQEP